MGEFCPGKGRMYRRRWGPPETPLGLHLWRGESELHPELSVLPASSADPSGRACSALPRVPLPWGGGAGCSTPGLSPQEPQLCHHGCSISGLTPEGPVPPDSIHNLFSSREETAFLPSFESGWRVSIETFVVTQHQYFGLSPSFLLVLCEGICGCCVISWAEWVVYMARLSWGINLVSLSLWWVFLCLKLCCNNPSCGQEVLVQSLICMGRVLSKR